MFMFNVVHVEDDVDVYVDVYLDDEFDVDVDDKFDVDDDDDEFDEFENQNQFSLTLRPFFLLKIV